jgi:hypothetical protein
MKYSNLKIGMKVVVKDNVTCNWFNPYKGCQGVIVNYDAKSDDDHLGVCVEFKDGRVFWGDHKDLKKVKSK